MPQNFYQFKGSLAVLLSGTILLFIQKDKAVVLDREKSIFRRMESGYQG